jgi:hypothetical protein
LFALLCSAIYQLSQRRWLKAIVTGLLLAGTLAILLFYSLILFFIDTVDGDNWADDLTIPKNIHFEQPLDMDLGQERADSLKAWKKTATDFVLYNSFQPGLFEYDLWLGKIDSGIVYLKAFEVTQEYALSTDRLPERSSIAVYNPTDSIMHFGTTTHFTIYEGDWGKPYGARFEVWYKSSKSHAERKLLQKNYVIEGWMR